MLIQNQVNHVLIKLLPFDHFDGTGIVYSNNLDLSPSELETELAVLDSMQIFHQSNRIHIILRN